MFFILKIILDKEAEDYRKTKTEQNPEVQIEEQTDQWFSDDIKTSNQFAGYSHHFLIFLLFVPF